MSEDISATSGVAPVNGAATNFDAEIVRPLRALDGVICAQVHVRGVRRKMHLLLPRHTAELLSFRCRRNVVSKTFLQFANRLCRPHPRVQYVHRLSRQTQIHWRHRKLQAPAALQKNHRVFVRNSQQPPQPPFRFRQNALKLRRTVAHLHDRHSASTPIQQFLAHPLQHRERQRSRPGIKIENPLGSFIRLQNSWRSYHDHPFKTCAQTARRIVTLSAIQNTRTLRIPRLARTKARGQKNVAALTLPRTLI